MPRCPIRQHLSLDEDWCISQIVCLDGVLVHWRLGALLGNAVQLRCGNRSYAPHTENLTCSMKEERIQMFLAYPDAVAGASVMK